MLFSTSPFFRLSDIGLEQFTTATLFVKLLTPTSFLMVIIIQVHYFQRPFLDMSDIHRYMWVWHQWHWSVTLMHVCKLTLSYDIDMCIRGDNCLEVYRFPFFGLTVFCYVLVDLVHKSRGDFGPNISAFFVLVSLGEMLYFIFYPF